SVGGARGVDPRGLLRSACAPKCGVHFGQDAARASGWRARSVGAMALGACASRRSGVLDAAGRDPCGVVGCGRMNILTINLVLSTLVFWIAARIYVLPRLDELGPRTILLPILLLHAFRHLGLMFLAPRSDLQWHPGRVRISGSVWRSG